MRVPQSPGILKETLLERRLDRRRPATPARATTSSVAHQQEKPSCLKNQSGITTTRSQPRTWNLSILINHRPTLRRAGLLLFSRPIKRAWRDVMVLQQSIGLKAT